MDSRDFRRLQRSVYRADGADADTASRPYTDFLYRLPFGGMTHLGWHNIFLTLLNIALTIAVWRAVRRAMCRAATFRSGRFAS